MLASLDEISTPTLLQSSACPRQFKYARALPSVGQIKAFLHQRDEKVGVLSIVSRAATCSPRRPRERTAINDCRNLASSTNASYVFCLVLSGTLSRTA